MIGLKSCSRTISAARRSACWTMLIVGVGLFVALDHSSVLASGQGIDLGAPSVVGETNGEGYLILALPADLAGQIDGRVNEAVLNLTCGWIQPGMIVEAIPFDTAADSIPEGGLPRGGSRSSLLGRAVVVYRDGGSGQCTIPLRRLVQAVDGAASTADKILLGLRTGDEVYGRWPAAALERFNQNPSAWSAKLYIYSSSPD